MASQTEISLYLDRARTVLAQSRDNLRLHHHDIVISRAYYAMFYAATALLHSKGISRSKHSGVHSAVGEHFVKPGTLEPEYGRMLVNAFNLRLDSDYDVNPVLDQDLAQDVLLDAERFVERVTRYLDEEGLL
ncbi:MAG: HEPN domain-containing protein [Anaerolineae bacterium]|nr:HEPN domain-containing protein [Anaerolineae bacterium]